MKFAEWDSSRRYAEHTAPGWIPAGTTVNFVDGTTGRVINGNGERSLVSYTPDKRSGMSEALDWFQNSELLIAA